MPTFSRKTFLPLIAVAAIGFAGCGDDDDDDGGNSGGTPPAAQTTATTTPQDTGNAPAVTTPDGSSTVRNVDDAVKLCESEVKKNLPADQQAKALDLCKSAADASKAPTQISDAAQKKIDEAKKLAQQGDTEGAVKVAREACVEQAKSQLNGSAEETAVKLCEQNIKAP